MHRSIKVSRPNRADRLETVLRHADATFERWFRRARKRSAGVLRHRVDNLQAGLKKLSAGLEQLERDHKVTLVRLEGDQKVTLSKHRARAPIVRKPSSPRKRKKAA